jgi:hypothetical protein
MSKSIDVEPFVFPRWILETFIGLTPAEITKVLPDPLDENNSSQSTE